MLKTLLLGSATGLAAVASAQAADLPVKAKPVEYVKVCSLYGAGYWYLPGTDTCFKLGMRMTAATAFGDTDASGAVAGSGVQAGQLRHDRAETNPLPGLYWRAQTTFDFRTASQYGVVRSYFNVGWQQRMPQDTALYVKNAFVQFAGFTVGRASSAFDFVDPTSYALQTPRELNNQSIGGIAAATYTFQLGGGFSASVSLEDGGFNSANYGESVSNFFGPSLGGTGRGRPVQNIVLANPFAGATAVGAFPSGVAGVNANPGGSIGSVTNNSGPNNFFDIVGNLRYDSPALSAQIMGALHQITADYYTLGVNGVGQNFPGSPGCGGANANSPPSPGLVCNYFGHPDDVWGWALGAGVIIKNAFGWQGDEFALEAIYGNGANGYVLGTSQAAIYSGGNKAAIFGNVNDAFIGSTSAFSGTDLKTTSSWTVMGIYQHYWTPTLRHSFQAGYAAYDVGGSNKALICGGNGAFAGGNVAAISGLVQNQTTAALVAGGAPAGSVFNCDPNWSVVTLGTRLEWLPMPLLRIGAEYWFNHYNTSFKGYANLAASGARPAGLYKIDDVDTNAVTLYIRKELLYP
jgi:hypothetical protein